VVRFSFGKRRWLAEMRDAEVDRGVAGTPHYVNKGRECKADRDGDGTVDVNELAAFALSTSRFVRHTR
jgi:hypothetical protein